MEEKQKTKEESWAEIIKGWEGSGLAQRAYCTQNGIAISAFLYWRKRLKRIRNKATFVKVSAKRQTIKNKSHLFIKGGVRISFKKGTDIKLLARIIEVINREV